MAGYDFRDEEEITRIFIRSHLINYHLRRTGILWYELNIVFRSMIRLDFNLANKYVVHVATSHRWIIWWMYFSCSFMRLLFSFREWLSTENNITYILTFNVRALTSNWWPLTSARPGN